MKHPRILIVFYGHKCHTRGFVRRIAEYLGADVEELRVMPRPGLFGPITMAAQRLLNLETELAPLQFDPYLYDVVIIGSPVINASVSAPVRTFLHRRGDRIHNAAFFLTAGHTGFERSLWQLCRLSHRRPLATLTLREGDMATGRYADRIKRFIRSLMQAWSSETLLDPTAELLFRKP